MAMTAGALGRMAPEGNLVRNRSVLQASITRGGSGNKATSLQIRYVLRLPDNSGFGVQNERSVHVAGESGAEGIENRDARGVFSDLAVDYGQGYYLGWLSSIEELGTGEIPAAITIP